MKSILNADGTQFLPVKIEFEKVYTLKTNGRKFCRFKISTDEQTRFYDICVRRGRREPGIMNRTEARDRAWLLFSMGEELEGMTQQLVNRFTQYGETEIKRCYRIAADAGIIRRWNFWMITIQYQLPKTGTSEDRFCEYIKQEASLW